MILDKILQWKKQEIQKSKKAQPLKQLEKAARKKSRAEGQRAKHAFLKALKAKQKPLVVIAEIKKKSPSKGIFRKTFNPTKIARQYQAAGAAALSVLTDQQFFGGSGEILKKVRKTTKLPILRKDFILEDYQVYEAKLWGASAILLIVGALKTPELKKLSALAGSLGMDTLFEVHTASELKRLLPLKPKLLGINNRNLRTFKVNLATTQRLAAQVRKQKCLIVSESGIRTHADLIHLQKLGVRAVLVGELLMKDSDPGKALKKLLGKNDTR